MGFEMLLLEWKATAVPSFCTEGQGCMSAPLSPGSPGRRLLQLRQGPAAQGCSRKPAVAERPGAQTAQVRLHCTSQGVIRDTDEPRRHLDFAPRELESEKAISFCSGFSKYLETGISLGKGPALLTCLLQTPLFGSCIWCSSMWHNNDYIFGVKKASTGSDSTKPQSWENHAGFSFGCYKEN